MATISLCMIVKNEEKVLDRALTSAKNLFDEIIIVDTGSTDTTKTIAKKYTDKVYDFEWKDDFSLARNYSFSLAKSDYIMWLDADDVLSEKLKKDFFKIKSLLTRKNVDVLMLKYDVAFDENRNPTFSFYRERIVKNNKKFIWYGAVHEVLIPSGNIINLNYSVLHLTDKKIYTDRNLKIYEKLISEGKTLSAREQFYYGRELMYNGKTKNAITVLEQFLSRKDAFTENLISACIDLSSCYEKVNDIQKAKESLLKSFLFDSPRAEVCCMFGDYLLKENNYNKAIFWYKLALKDKINLSTGGFVQPLFYNIYPLLQLCLCYYYLGDYSSSEKYNDKVYKYDKNNTAYINNKKFFDSLKNINNNK